MNNLNNLFSLDVEADGPCPGLYSMVSMGIVLVEDPTQHFYRTICPISEQYIPDALKVSGFTREQTLGFASAEQVMTEMANWVSQLNLKSRGIIWSDNPGFDWQFLNYYCHAYLKTNPFGHSSRRIGDYWAGLHKNPRETKSWKKLRETKHTHNALDDAMGNAQAIKKMLTKANLIK